MKRYAFTLGIISAAILAVNFPGTARGSLIDSEDVTLNVTVCNGTDCGAPVPPSGGHVPGISYGGTTSSASSSLAVPNGVAVRGYAYPGSTVILLRDGTFAASVPAGPDARFEFFIGGISPGVFTYVVYARDANGVRSSLFPITVSLTNGVTTVISGIFLSPTVSLDKQAIRKGETLTVMGQTVPNADVSLRFHSTFVLNQEIKAAADGFWRYVLDTDALEYGTHTARARSASNAEQSSLSPLLNFTVGDKNVLFPQALPSPADLNKDGNTNISDFSVLLYWYRRPNPPATADLNDDGVIDLKDFSILAYHWTG